MTDPGSGSPQTQVGASRRLFFKFLAASPLAALAYAAVPSSWLEPLAAEAQPNGAAVPSSVPPTVSCVNCGAPVFPPVSPERYFPGSRREFHQ